MSSYPLLIIVESILKRTFALMALRECAGMMIDSPVSNRCDVSFITISAFPSIICIKVSKGEVLSENVSPESNETALIFPVVFFIIVLINTEFGMYSNISTTMNAFDFSNSEVSTLNKLYRNELNNYKYLLTNLIVDVLKSDF